MKTTILSFVMATIMVVMSAETFSRGSNDEPGAKSTVSGKVTDQTTGESLAGVCVQIQGTNIKTFTDLEGNFSINNLDPGIYTFELHYISYKQEVISDLTFSSGNTRRLEIQMNAE